jgi:YHS domain-containing protein
MKKLGLIISAFMMMGAYTFGGAANTLCPISGKAIGDATSEVKAEFCCNKCKAKFDAEPTKFAGKLAKTEEGKCVISGKDASESSTLTVGFCCDKCKAKFDAEPKKFLGKLAPKKDGDKKKKKDS